MAQYMVIAPHTPEECGKTLDEIVSQNPKYLDVTYFGCAAGDHTGWAILEAGSEGAARNLLPTSVRGKARVVPVGKFTPAQIASFHKK